MKTIVVATDFSPCSKDALNYAISIAQNTSSRIALLNSFFVEVADPNMTPYAEDLLYEEKEREVEDELNELCATITSKTDIHGNRLKYEKIYSCTSAVESIINTSSQRKDSIIVMGAHGNAKPKLVGGTVLQVIENSLVPVIVVPEGAAFSKLKYIVYVTDFAAGDCSILKWLSAFAEQFDSEITVIHIDSFEDIEPYQASISDFIKANQIDLLALAKYKRNFKEDLFHKSLAKGMIIYSNVPLLLFHKPINK